MSDTKKRTCNWDVFQHGKFQPCGAPVDFCTSDGPPYLCADHAKDWGDAFGFGSLRVLPQSAKASATAEGCNLETCQCCGDVIGMLSAVVETGGVYCRKCKTDNAEVSDQRGDGSLKWLVRARQIDY
jgi:hypothetical protein